MAGKPRKRAHLTPTALRTKERSAEAAKLRVAGLSYRQIGERMGLTASSAHDLVSKAAQGFELAAAEAIETQRRLELARLDYATTVVMQQVAKLASSTKPNPASIDQLIRISERRAKLLGLDAATEVKVQQEMGREIEAVMGRLRGALTDAEFARAVAALGTGGEADSSADAPVH